MTKKLTPAAIALLEAARSGVPGAMRASIAEIVKDAPQIPGIVALEKEYGAGNIPLTAVHASNLLSLEDKKFLFQIAGFEYDGTMPEKKLQTKEIPQSVITGMSASAFFKLTMALEIAMEHGGFEAVVAVCKDMTDGAAETDRPVGIWADAEWRGLDLVESMFPGSTINRKAK